jgi:hypothetical protein
MSTEQLLDKAAIAKVLSSEGPVVKCVLLRAVPKDGKDSHPHAAISLDGKPHAVEKVEQELEIIPPKQDEKDDENGEPSKPKHHGKVLDHLIEQLELDMTPSKSMVQKTLGGPFTFLGQYEDEGVVIMTRKVHEDEEDYPTQEELEGLKLSELKLLLEDRDISPEAMLEKSDMVQALLKDFELPPINPHQLQPPLHKKTVRGDILVVKVAETEEELDQEEGAEEKQVVVPTNDEFFLDYTMDQYIQFASRTDIEEHEIEEPEEESDEEDSDEGEEGEGFVMGGDDEEIAEEDKSAMFNLVMNEVLRQYRADNGRGPNTQELLELRSAIAKQLEVEVAEIDADGADWDKKAKETPTNKRKIAFSTDTKVMEYVPDPDEHDHHNAAESDDEDYEEEEEEPPTKKLKSSGDDSEDDEEDSKPAAIEKKPPIADEEKESKEPEKSDCNPER